MSRKTFKVIKVMTYVSFQLFSQEKSCKIAKLLSYNEKYSSTILNEKNDVTIGLVKQYLK
jgi:hypothetical protein